MAQSNLPLNPQAYMESANNPEVFEAIYGQHVCIENAFSDATIERIHSAITAASYLVTTTVSTGGGPGDGRRWPDRACVRGNPAAYSQIRTSNQFRLSSAIGGDTAVSEINAYMAVNDPGHRQYVKPNDVNVSMSNFMWRFNHRVGTAFRRIPATAEISHHAEGYNQAHPEWHAAKVEVSEMEHYLINESRKSCTMGALMWRKLDGTLIDEDEIDAYKGPTLCWHGAFGTPCYAPHPVVTHEPTGLTINTRKGVTKPKRKREGNTGAEHKQLMPTPAK